MIKNMYGEELKKLCRELFPTLLEKEILYNILSLTFATNSKTLANDIIEKDLKITLKK